ncbi:MAG TPA: N-acetylmuramoyl-L-alanine amidase [Gemmatimonadales bacterium]|nr:N-acetylmuramoyl-L-alanine amidase [Gemmatimonadales bacterium]
MVLALGASSCGSASHRTPDPLSGRTIVLDPGHGGTAATDSYRVGPGGEREEWIDLRVALILRDLLEARGARVILTRDADTDVPLRARADLARDSAADAFISIHHNATADPAVNFPIVYYHGYASANEAGVSLARHVARHLTHALFADTVEPSVVSDHVIFAGSGTAVLRHSYGIPGVIGEASFFTNPGEERRLRDATYNRREAEAYVRALHDFFSEPVPPVRPAGTVTPLERFETAQEAERMSEVARRWREDYEEGRRLMEGPDADFDRAYELLTRSARNFPDSPVARDAHLLRARILDERGRAAEAAETRRRVQEFHP